MNAFEIGAAVGCAGIAVASVGLTAVAAPTLVAVPGLSLLVSLSLATTSATVISHSWVIRPPLHLWLLRSLVLWLTPLVLQSTSKVSDDLIPPTWGVFRRVLRSSTCL